MLRGINKLGSWPTTVAGYVKQLDDLFCRQQAFAHQSPQHRRKLNGNGRV